jgi:hypothetical protein
MDAYASYATQVDSAVNEREMAQRPAVRLQKFVQEGITNHELVAHLEFNAPECAPPFAHFGKDLGPEGRRRRWSKRAVCVDREMRQVRKRSRCQGERGNGTRVFPSGEGKRGQEWEERSETEERQVVDFGAVDDV